MVKSSGLSKRSKKAPGSPARGKRASPNGKRPAKPPAETPPPIPLSGRSEDGTEQKILDAARSEFIAKGIDGARMQVIAQRAAVNKALLHYYYRSKEKLYQTVLQDILQSVWGRIQAEFQERGKPDGLEPVLHTLVSSYIRTLSANPEFPLFIFREVASGGHAFQPLLTQTLAKFSEVPAAVFRALRSEIMAGRARPTHPAHFFMNVMGMCVITFLAKPMVEKFDMLGITLNPGEKFLEERIQAITNMALHGVLIKR
jgi:TetR/AcrR family transcriptional regulator